MCSCHLLVLSLPDPGPWFWSYSSAAVHRKVRGVKWTGQDRTWPEGYTEKEYTRTNNDSKQCLALNPHPLRLELLAHVGYVTYYYHYRLHKQH